MRRNAQEVNTSFSLHSYILYYFYKGLLTLFQHLSLPVSVIWFVDMIVLF